MKKKKVKLLLEQFEQAFTKLLSNLIKMIRKIKET
jgi:hypothetical protein